MLTRLVSLLKQELSLEKRLDRRSGRSLREECALLNLMILALSVTAKRFTIGEDR